MALNISKALNIENKERGVVFLLLTQSIFLGIFAGALDVGANSLFLEAYSADDMPTAFMISGVVGISFTSLYTFLQKRVPFKLFTILNLFVAILLVGALRVGYSIFEGRRELAFALLVLMGPVIIISMLGFWGTAGRYFTLREGKRLFGIIDTGSVVGMILAFYSVPVLVRFNFNVRDTLLIGLFSLLAAMLFQIIVLQRHKLLTTTSTKRVKKEKKSGFLNIFRKRYTALMALFVVLSVITGFFIHYSFMWVTQANYPDGKELTSFIGAFFGTMMIFTVVIKSTLYGWLMKNYGLRITLLISPALLLILTVVASGVGGFFGYGPESASFTFFFLVLTLSKLFNKSLKDSIESPSMKILYQSLDSGERFDVQASIDGIVNELTAFSAGLIMAGLLFLSFIHVIHFSYILIGLLFIWLVVAYALYKSYTKTLNDSLANVKSSSSTVEDQEIEVVLPDPVKIPMYSDLIKLNPYFYHYVKKGKLEDLLRSKDKRRQIYTWQFVIGTLYYCDSKEVDSILKTNSDQDLDFIINNYKQRLNLPGDKIDDAFRSYDQNEILAALIQTVQKNDTAQVSRIITLLRDRDMQLRATAIEAAGSLKMKELGSYLVDYLGHPQLYSVTWSSLVKTGEPILENLENMFHKKGVEGFVQLRIVRAMIEIGGEKVKKHLFQKITYHQRDIREAAIKGLYELSFTPTEKEIVDLQVVIYEVALAGAMNIAAEFVIRENKNVWGLLEAISEERLRTDKILFYLLGITYDKSAIEHVQQSIEDTENEDTGFALELLNLLIDDQVFAYLEPYFDDISVNDKIRRLQNEMPVEILSYEELLIDLLNRDSLYAGNYLKICALEAIRKEDEINAGQFLAAQAFHPNLAISKTALITLSEKDVSLHDDLSRRITGLTKKNKDNYFSSEYSGERIVKIVEDFKQWKTFNSLRRELIFKFVNYFEKEENIDLENREMVTLIKAESSENIILSSGLVIILTDYPTLLEQIKYIASREKLIIYQIKRTIFRELLFDEPGILSACNALFSNEITTELIELKVNN